jgi:hypothetical protein
MENLQESGHEPEKKLIIKVVDTSKTFLDIMKISVDEVNTIMNEIMSTADADTRKIMVGYNKFPNLVRKYHRRSKYSRQIIYDDDISTLREIFVNDNVLPIVGHRGDSVLAERHDGKKYIYTKAKTRKYATDMMLNEVYLSQDEPFQILGILYSTHYYKHESENIIKKLDRKYSIPIFKTKTAQSVGGQTFMKYSAKLGYRVININNTTEIINKLIRQLNYIQRFVNGPVYSQLVAETNSRIYTHITAKETTVAPINTVLNILTNNSHIASNDFMQIILKIIENLIKLELAPSILMEMKKLSYSDMVYYNTIINVGAILALSKLVSDENAYIGSMLNSIKISKEQEITEREMFLSYIQTVSKIGRFINIIVSKFGVNRLLEIYKIMLKKGTASAKVDMGGSMSSIMEIIKIHNLDFIMDELTKDEQEVIVSDYNLENELAEAERNNKCRHIKLVYDLRHAHTSEMTLALLDKIQDMAVADNKEDWLICKVCKFKLICPHVMITHRMMATSAPYAKIFHTMQPYFASMQDTELKAHTILAIEPKSINFCKICYEKINSEFPDRVVLSNAGLFGGTGSFLLSKIWGMTFTFYKYIIFPAPVNAKSFANNVAATVNYYIVSENENDIKWKKNIINEIVDNSTTINITLYICAYIMEMIRLSRASDMRITIEGINENAPYSIILNKLIDIIMTEFRGIISKVTDISLDYMQNKIKTIFTILMTNGDITMTNYDPIMELIDMLTSYDYAFSYAFITARICKVLPPTIDTAEKVRQAIASILGKDLEKIIIFAKRNMTNPKYKGLFSRGAGVKVPPGSSLKYLYKDEEINLHSKIFEINLEKNKYMALCVKDFLEGNIKSANFAAGAYFQSYILFCMYTKKLFNKENEEDYLEKLKEYRKNEKYLNKNQRLMKSIPSKDKVIHMEYRAIREMTEEIQITELYDEMGNAHNWGANSTFYYMVNNEEVAFKGAAELANAHKNEKMAPGLPVDIGCSKCGCRKSQTHMLDSNKVLNSLEIAENIGSFYEFYSYRCPESEYHSWSDKECKNCKLTLLLYNNILATRIIIKDDKSAVEYYKKYYKKYQQDRKQNRLINKVDSVNKAVSVRNTELRKVNEKKMIEQIKQWNTDFTSIAKCANIAKCSTELIKTMGCVDGRRYRDVIEGKNIPPPPSKRDDSRIYTAESELKLAVSAYRTFINANMENKLDNRYNQAFEQNKLSMAEVMNFVLSERSNIKIDCSCVKLPTIARWHLEPAVMLDYIVELFCTFVLSIYNSPNDKKNILKIFAETTINIMVQNQRTFAMPEKIDTILDESDETELLNGDDLVDDEDE